MKCIFAIDGINYLSQTKREARKFIDFYHANAITFQYPRPFKTTWRFETIERAPSYGQMERICFEKVDFGKNSS